MLLSEVAIKRPVFCTVMSLLIIVFGGYFFTKLQLRGSPDINPPVITVQAYYAGASAEYMEQNITNRLEKHLKSLNNLDYMSSSSTDSGANITLFFNLDTDLDRSLSDVRSKISEIHGFPTDMALPTASKMDADARPSLWLAITSDAIDSMELTDIINQQIMPPLERLSAVGASVIYGARDYSIRISPDPLKMYGARVTPVDIVTAVTSQTKDYPPGMIYTPDVNFSLKLRNALTTPEEYKKLVVTNKDGQNIHVGDIAQVFMAPYEEKAVLKYNSKKAIAVGLVVQSGMDNIKLSDQVHDLLPYLRSIAPQNVDIKIAYDNSVPVRDSINAVYRTLFEAIIFVAAVIFLFLGAPSITLIPLLTIPISLIGTFAIMHLLGFSINMFSLLAMVLAIGLVVDDAIVMLENIYRHHEEGLSGREAAFVAVREIGFAVIAMTITLAAVFLPIGMIDGFVGKLFVEFAWTLAVCVLVSGFVALTLTPMLSSKMVEGSKKEFAIIKVFSRVISRLRDNYLTALKWVLGHIRILAVICIASVGVLVIALKFTGKTFTPQEDQGILYVYGSGAEGATLLDTNSTTSKFENILEDCKDISGYFTIAGYGGENTMGAFISLQHPPLRTQSVFGIRKELQQKAGMLPTMSIGLNVPGSQLGGGGSPVIFHITTRGSDIKQLDILSKKFLERMKQEAVFANPDRDLRTSVPAINAAIDYDKAAMYGIDPTIIGNSIRYAIGGDKVTEFRKGSEIYNVVLSYALSTRNHTGALSEIFLPSSSGALVNLANLAVISESPAVNAYAHYNSKLSVTLNSDLADGMTIEAALQKIQQIRQDLFDSELFSIELDGELKRMDQSNSSMLLIFGISLVIIFLVLAAQFESFLDSALILFAVPFSMTGGVVGLWLFDDTLNLYSNIGLITLVGLVTKNSIMLVEFANQLREKGIATIDAVLESAKLRFRPIVMTTTATIFGAMPLIFVHGSGAGASHSIGIVIVSGMIIGTFFTMFVIPALYIKIKRR